MKGQRKTVIPLQVSLFFSTFPLRALLILTLRDLIYITVDVMFAGRGGRLFFTKCSKHAKWNGLITTNRELTFLQSYKIYSMKKRKN